MSVEKLTRDAVLRIGEVCGVDGRRINVLVDKNKNLSDMFLDGDILRNISVNSYVEIRKGFLSIIGRVEGEKIEEEFRPIDKASREVVNRVKRVLTVSLAGYIDETGIFTGGTRELPLIGNEAYVITRQKMHLVHNLVRPGSPSVTIATIFGEDFDIGFPVDGLFNSHIAIFGNTGSGKSNTLACLYQDLVRVLSERNAQAFVQNTRFVLFDFNGEYTNPACITQDKTVYNLSTRGNDGDRVPLDENGLLDIEVLSILADATEKTQKPFLRRTLRFHSYVHSNDVDNPEAYLRGVMCNCVNDTLQMSEKIRAFLLVDYFREIFQLGDDGGELADLVGDLDWHNQSQEFYIKTTNTYLRQHPDRIRETQLYNLANNFTLPDSLLSRLIIFLYLQLIRDVIANRAQNEHIAPVINRLKGKKHDIAKLFNLGGGNFWQHNFVVVNLDDVNLDMKKTLPLLLSKKLYTEHKMRGTDQSLNIIIDEAHNILSTESFREAESWKDYRLETFEEVIKEGRKFGVFVTIASQRPNDISPTITSQAHNYFIHRLINERDLRTISSVVSYIDRVTEESIPTLPTGTCVFSGVASQMPLKINVNPLDENARPRSATRAFADIVPVLPEEA
jgi:DNA helicase HerA-like ATPase